MTGQRCDCDYFIEQPDGRCDCGHTEEQHPDGHACTASESDEDRAATLAKVREERFGPTPGGAR